MLGFALFYFVSARDAICYFLSFSRGYKDVIKESKFYRLKRRNAEMYKIDKHFIKMGFLEKERFSLVFSYL